MKRKGKLKDYSFKDLLAEVIIVFILLAPWGGLNFKQIKATKKELVQFLEYMKDKNEHQRWINKTLGVSL